MARKSRKSQPQTELAPKPIIYDTWGYTRISVDGERSDDSIEGQRAIIQDYVSGKTDIELCGMITDLGYRSGTYDLEIRPHFND